MPDVDEGLAALESLAVHEPEPPPKPARPEFSDPLAHALADLEIARAELARVQERNIAVERALEIARAERDEARKALADKA